MTRRTKILSGMVALAVGLTIAMPEARWGSLRLGYGLMPLSTTLILVLAATTIRPRSPRYRWGIVSGLVCSLAGDVLLMLPRDLFLAGLTAFLLAQGCYLIAFTAEVPLGARRVPFLFWGAVGACLLVPLQPRIPAVLQVPVAAYAGCLLTMAAQATACALLQRTPSAVGAAVGAALFVCSDALLGIKRFGGTVPWSRLLILGTYFAAQWLIALSVESGGARRRRNPATPEDRERPRGAGSSPWS